VFLFCPQFYNDYGDIIKATLSKAREINKVVTGKTLISSLTQVIAYFTLTPLFILKDEKILYYYFIFTNINEEVPMTPCENSLK